MPIKRINQNWVKCDGCGIEHYDPAVTISDQLRIEKLNHWTGNKDEIYCPECSRKIAAAKAKKKWVFDKSCGCPKKGGVD